MTQRVQVLLGFVSAALVAACGQGEAERSLGSNSSHAATTASCTSPTTTTTVQVNAFMGITPPTDTGITIPAGGSVVVTAAGSWSVGATQYYGTAFGPNGTTPPKGEACMLVPTAPMGTLIGSLDNGATWFAIGAGPTIVNGPGHLLLAQNDCPGVPYGTFYSDNTGFVTATITTRVPPIQALTQSLTTLIASLNLGAEDTAELLALVQKIPTVVNSLTPIQKQIGVAAMNGLIGAVNGLVSEHKISAAQGEQVVTVACEVIAVLTQ